MRAPSWPIRIVSTLVAVVILCAVGVIVRPATLGEERCSWITGRCAIYAEAVTPVEANGPVMFLDADRTHVRAASDLGDLTPYRARTRLRAGSRGWIAEP